MGAKTRSNYAHHPNPEVTCIPCVFGGDGPHADWCKKVPDATDACYRALKEGRVLVCEPKPLDFYELPSCQPEDYVAAGGTAE